LRVIGDISCDIEGSIELTIKATQPDAPTYVVDPDTGAIQDGVAGRGPVIMAVDNLPCELPRESSEYFSAVLREFMPALADMDTSRPLSEARLPSPIERAVILYNGEFTPDYRYMKSFL